ncbi:MAG: cell filamentation protein Fic, partial [Candidatus Obscuribacterales bacterium]|nr:cell filamentation protein Fic [Candidatus Obscuribacterales bacterium]
MASPGEKLAQSLELLHQLQKDGKVAIRSKDLTRIHRERLLKNGFLQEVMKGWYIPARPEEPQGESTAWYASFWAFCADYLFDRFDEDWCLSPEQSLSLHVGNRTVPKQLTVRSAKGKNNITMLLQDSSIFDLHSSMPQPSDIEKRDGLNVLTLPVSLVNCSPNFMRNNPTDVRAALTAISDASDVLAYLLEGGHSVIAGRLAGGFRNIGRQKIADDILKTMKSADFDCREEDPFDSAAPISFAKFERSPYVNR